MNFNADLTKQLQGLIFSRKVQMIDYFLLCFNQNIVQTSGQKHLEIAS